MVQTQSLRPRSIRRVVIGACGALGLLTMATGAHAQAGPFAGLAGVWTGGGTIALEGGATERIRCRATYAVNPSGNGLNQSLVCASDSYKFELRSNLVSENGAVSGQWSETSRGVSGSLAGRASNGRFDIAVSAPAFSAKLTLTTRGSSQTVAISADGQFRGANIALKRS